MVFPGVLRGRPGPRLATIHTSRLRRSLSSPWMCCPSSVAGPCPDEAHRQRVRELGEGPRTKRRTRAELELKQVDAVPGRFEEPFAARPEGLAKIGGAASHLGGLALCGSGSASSSNVRLLPSFVKGIFATSPHV